MFRGSVKNTGYPVHSPVSPSLPLPCVTVCHHISTGLYYWWWSYTPPSPSTDSPLKQQYSPSFSVNTFHTE